MSRRLWVFGAGVPLVAIVAALLALVLGAGSSAPSRLAGAELLGGGGSTPLDDVDAGGQLDEVDLYAEFLAAGPDGSFWVSEVAGGMARVSVTGEVLEIASPSPTTFAEVAAIASDGRTAGAEGLSVYTTAFGKSRPDFTMSAGFDVGAVAFAPDGSLLLGSSAETQIDSVDPDNGVVRHILEPAALGPITAIAALPDDRIAFVADGELHVLDDGNVRTIASLDGSLAPGPDGGLLVTGSRQVSLVDVETGRSRVVADLADVEPSPDNPVEAVAVGDDLIFLADARIWRNEDRLKAR